MARPVGSKDVKPRMSAGRKAAESALASQKGETPVQFMLRVMRDRRNDKETRLRAAGMVAPYLHPKLQSVEVASVKDETGESQLVVKIVRV